MNINKIASSLTNRGLTAEVREVIKNGVKRQAITVLKEKASPTFYVDTMGDLSDEQITDKIEHIVRNTEEPEIDTSLISDRDYILDNVIPAIQRRSDEDIVKFPIADLDVYFRVRMSMGGSFASYKVTNALLKSIGVSENELFERALYNVRPHLHICSMAKMLSEKMGFPIDEAAEIPMYVAYSDLDAFGSSAVLCDDLMQDLADKLGSKRLACLPSSVHEWIILDMDEYTDLDALSSMVREVNFSEVSDDEVLGTHAYIWEDGNLR